MWRVIFLIAAVSVQVKGDGTSCLFELMFSSTPSLPECDSEGNYTPRQCVQDSCYCAERITGVKLPGYEEVSQSSTCQCARDKFEVTRVNPGATFFCDDDGNYDMIHCFGNLCRCVMPNGTGVGSSFVESDPDPDMCEDTVKQAYTSAGD